MTCRPLKKPYYHHLTIKDSPTFHQHFTHHQSTTINQPLTNSLIINHYIITNHVSIIHQPFTHHSPTMTSHRQAALRGGPPPDVPAVPAAVAPTAPGPGPVELRLRLRIQLGGSVEPWRSCVIWSGGSITMVVVTPWMKRATPG